jgi:hypothetical protein
VGTLAGLTETEVKAGGTVAVTVVVTIVPFRNAVIVSVMVVAV